jgi:hypothetical protein
VLRIPLLQGRIWDESETIRGAKLALINQTLDLLLVECHEQRT